MKKARTNLLRNSLMKTSLKSIKPTKRTRPKRGKLIPIVHNLLTLLPPSIKRIKP